MSSIKDKLSILVSLVFILFTQQIALADVFLTSENLNTALKQIQRSQVQIQNQQDYETALYTLGKSADDLAKLLTDEVEAHGAENEKLIELALDRTKNIQVNISWEGRNSRFFYDGHALSEYLEKYPDGQYRMDTLYRTITRDFFLVLPEGENELLATIEKKKSFIHQYSDFEKLSEIELYLAIDYRDLWRLQKNNQDVNLISQTAMTARTQLQRIIDEYNQEDEGEIARRLLERFIVEADL